MTLFKQIFNINNNKIMPDIKKKEFGFKIGSDPEFSIILQNKRADASQTLRKILKGKKEFDDTGDGFKLDGHGMIGWDGASQTGEMRVKPENSPQEATNHFAAIFKAVAPYVNMFELSTLSTHASIGGHVHFEIPEMATKWNSERLIGIHRRMASFYLPILLSENKTNLALRTTQGYGGLKDYRMENHFNWPSGRSGYTYEFRVPSAEWMTTPKLINATLAYLGVIYHEILEHPKRFNEFSDIVFKSDKMAEALQALAIQEYELVTKQMIKRIRAYIKTFELYPLFQEECDYILSVKEPYKDKVKAGYNILNGFDLAVKETKISKRQFTSSKAIKEISKTKDIDSLKSFVNIHYNKDTKVSLYAEAITTRMAAWNMKFKNTYFLFGIRKGINALIAKSMDGKYIAGKDILKTVSDVGKTDELFKRIGEKFNSMHDLDDMWELNVLTGKAENVKNKAVIIGIPYDMRVDENVKPFLDLVWNIENGRTVGTKLSMKSDGLVDDTTKSPNEKGEVYKILSNIAPEADNGFVPDNGSRSADHQRDASETIIREQMQEQRIAANDIGSTPVMPRISPAGIHTAFEAARIPEPQASRVSEEMEDAVDALISDNHGDTDTDDF